MVGVAAIAVAAGVDGLRGESGTELTREPEPTATPTSTDPDEPVSAAEPGGILYYTDEDCRLEAVRLPGLEPAAVPNWRNCRFVLSPDASSVSKGRSGWDPVGDFLFRLEDGRIVVTSGHEPVGEGSPGPRPPGGRTGR